MAETVIVLVLILANGLFSLSEFAIASSRRTRLEAMVERQRRGEAAALALSQDPSRFLSIVQIGITLVSILIGFYTGSSLGNLLSNVIARAGVERAIATPAGFSIVVGFTTYLSIVIGELVPKRLALLAPERIACLVAPTMVLASRLLSPAVRLLAASTALVFRVFPKVTNETDAVTDHEIHAVVAEAEGAGVIEPAERHMISGVMRLGDRPVRGIMTPRTDVQWIDLGDDPSEIRDSVLSTRHSYLPVANGSIDAMLGVVHSRDLLRAMAAGQEFDLRSLVRSAPAIPDTVDALDVLAMLRSADVPIALVHDEFGHFEGIATPRTCSKRSWARFVPMKVATKTARFGGTMARGNCQARCRLRRWRNASLCGCRPNTTTRPPPATFWLN